MRFMKNGLKTNKKRNSNGIICEEPTKEQKEWVRRKMNNFYPECYFCDVCQCVHNPIDPRYNDTKFFNTVQELLDQFTEKKSVKKMMVTV